MSLRVFELAKELNVPTKDFIKKVNKLGIKVTGNFSVLNDGQVKKIKTDFLEPASRIQETVVTEEGETKVKKRRIISAKKAETGKKIKKSLNIKGEAPASKKSKAEAVKTAKEENVEATPAEKSADESVKAPVIENKEVAIEKPKKKVVKTEPKKAAPDVSKKPVVKAKKPDAPEVKEREKKKVTKPNKKSKEKFKDETDIKDTLGAMPTEKSSWDDDEKTEAPVPVVKKDKKPKSMIKIVRKAAKNAGGHDSSDYGRKKKFKGRKGFNKSAYGKNKKSDQPKHTFNPRKKELTVGDSITVGALASLIGIKVSDIIKTLMSLDMMMTVTQAMDSETAALVAGEHGIELKIEASVPDDEIVMPEDDEKDMVTRPPVVTIMGHVDHGKTSLLDKIRSANVTDGEAGGITQHIGAYLVNTPDGMISFLDTPGHEAFTAMRARGADVTDIVILVVAADDGPRPQTVEAIHHAKAADVSLIVAITKIDKPDASADKVVQQLMEYELVSEEFGGDIPMISVSSKSGEGIPKLLEMVQLQAEMMELKASKDRMAEGVVIESRLDKGKGNAATILVQKGTLKKGDNYVVGTEYGRVRAMWNDKGEKVRVAGPSTPVEIVGLNGLPKAGDKFNVGSDEKKVRSIAEVRKEKEKERKQSATSKKTLENLMESFGKGAQKKALNIIIKTDVIGSMEALSESLQKLGNEEVEVKIVHGAVGAITSTDVVLAAASDAIVIGFNTRPDQSAKRSAIEENVEIRMYSIIYEAIEDVKHALEGMLEPIIREEFQGKAKVLDIFNIPKIGIVAGVKVTEGKIVRNSPVRVLRDNVVIHDGKLASLKRFKDDAKEVMEGFECGLGIESYKDLRAGDELESYQRFETSAKLD